MSMAALPLPSARQIFKKITAATVQQRQIF
jgi:hypothetical protein